MEKKSTTREMFEESELNRELNKFLCMETQKSKRFIKDLKDSCLREYRRNLKESHPDVLQERWIAISTSKNAHMGVTFEGKLGVIFHYRKRNYRIRK